MTIDNSSADRRIQQGDTRRKFLNKIWKVLGILAILEAIGLIIAFLLPRKQTAIEGKFGAVITAGPVENFAINTVTPFPVGQFYLTRLEEGGFLALSRKCTHLGCTVPWNEEESKFICPCHSSAFDIAGSVLTAPAPRPLDIYPIHIENGIVKVNTGKRIKRSYFDSSQVAKP